MMRILLPVGVAALVGACTSYVDRYEKAVYDFEPTYCYQSIGGVECHRTPYHRDERRLVSYFGPHPSRYDKPEPPEPPVLTPPAMINYWVKDAEPIPRPAPHGDLSALPWLDPAVAAADANRVEFVRASQNPAGTEALLRHMGIGPDGRVLPMRPRKPDAARANAIDTTDAARPAAATRDGAEAGAAAARALADEAPPPLAAPVPPVVYLPVN